MDFGFYLLGSKFCIEHIIEHLTSGQLELSLNGLHLSTLYHPEYFVHLKNLDISNNNLRSVVAIAFLRFMEILNLDDNEINSCEGLQNLRELKHLSIQRNSILSESFMNFKLVVISLI